MNWFKSHISMIISDIFESEFQSTTLPTTTGLKTQLRFTRHATRLWERRLRWPEYTPRLGDVSMLRWVLTWEATSKAGGALLDEALPPHSSVEELV